MAYIMSVSQLDRTHVVLSFSNLSSVSESLHFLCIQKTSMLLIIRFGDPMSRVEKTHINFSVVRSGFKNLRYWFFLEEYILALSVASSTSLLSWVEDLCWVVTGTSRYDITTYNQLNPKVSLSKNSERGACKVRHSTASEYPELSASRNIPGVTVVRAWSRMFWDKLDVW